MSTTVGMAALADERLYYRYLNSLDAREVLAHYGAEHVTEQPGENGTTELVHSCLIDRVEPHHKNHDANPSACLAGDTVIHLRQGKKNSFPVRKKIEEIYKLWHNGVPHKYKEGKGYRKTPQGNWAACVTSGYKAHHLGTFLTEREAQEAVEEFRSEHPYKGARRYWHNIRTRSWDMDGDLYGRVGHVSDIWESGVKPLLSITTESGKILRCTAEHRVFSGAGWVTAGEIKAGEDWLFREGRGRDYTKPPRGVPKYLRTAIGLWTQNQRGGLILPVDLCYLCGKVFPFEELELDHVVPVVEDIARALDVTNLKPICGDCHRNKSTTENNFVERPGTKAKALPDRVVLVETSPAEMTYDMEVSDWQNLTANGLVVHNSVNVEKRKFVCYASKWRGDLFHLVMKMEGKESFSDALLAISDLIHAGPDDDETFREKLVRTMTAPGAYTVAPSSYGESILNPWIQWTMPHPYLTWRGITEEAVETLHIGWDEHDNRIVFPHFFKHQLVGFQKRVIPQEGWDSQTNAWRRHPWPGTAEQEPKYKSSMGFPKSETLYGYDYCRTGSLMDMHKMTHVVVVESPFSVAKAYSLGVPHVLATFGAKVSANQLALLHDFASVTVWFDDDEAGRAGERTIINGLPLSKVLVVKPDPGKDLADYTTKEEVQFKLDSAVPAFVKRAQYDAEKIRRRMR